MKIHWRGQLKDQYLFCMMQTAFAGAGVLNREGRLPSDDLVLPRLRNWQPPPPVDEKVNPLEELRRKIVRGVERHWARPSGYEPPRTNPFSFGNTGNPYRDFSGANARDFLLAKKVYDQTNGNAGFINLPGNRSGIYTYQTPINQLHPDLVGLRILHLTDIHLRKNCPKSLLELQKIADALENGVIDADVCILTGDLITISPDDLRIADGAPGLRALQRITSACKHNYFVLGNHDHYGRAPELITQQLQRVGFVDVTTKSPRDQGIIFNVGKATVCIFGIADYLFGETYIPRDLCPADLILKILHNPDGNQSNSPWFDIAFCGHTHWGEYKGGVGTKLMDFWQYLEDINRHTEGFDVLRAEEERTSSVHVGRGLTAHYGTELTEPYIHKPGAALFTLLAL